MLQNHIMFFVKNFISELFYKRYKTLFFKYVLYYIWITFGTIRHLNDFSYNPTLQLSYHAIPVLNICKVKIQLGNLPISNIVHKLVYTNIIISSVEDKKKM